MNKTIKRGLIGATGLIVLIIVALIIIPMFVDISSFKPQIEKQVSRATGRSFSMSDDISLSLFPWVGVSLSDLRLGSLPGFEEKNFVTVKSFEVRVKLIPLLFKDVQVKRFILKAPRIVLEKRKDGKGNWEGLGKTEGKAIPKTRTKEENPPKELPLKSLVVGEFAITEGSVLWIDKKEGMRKEVSDMTFRLKDVSMDKPVKLDFSAKLDKKPVSLKGSVGPLGKEIGKGTIPIDLTVEALKEIDVRLKGSLTDPATNPKFDLLFQLSPFSPRKVMEALGQDFPVETTDSKALTRVALKARLKGNKKNLSLSDGTLELDESKATFSLNAKDFSSPDLAFNIDLDRIDLDRYLPPKGKETPKKAVSSMPASSKKKIDYAPLRKLSVNGSIHMGELKASNAKIQDMNLKVSGKNGVFHLNPLTMKLYQGSVSITGTVDVRQNTPKSRVAVNAEGIQVGPLLKDVKDKDFLEGTVKANIAVNMAGDEPDMIKRTLNGKGDLFFTDGAIVGIDLAGMVRNVKAAFGLAKKEERPKTDFAELHIPFTITNGLVNIPDADLKSPLIRVTAKGTANLVTEALDFRVQPKVVATLKGQGDTKQRSGLIVPVLVSGTFSSPSFRPDLAGLVKENVKGVISDPTKIKDILPIPGKETVDKVGEKTKDLIKGLPGLPFGK